MISADFQHCLTAAMRGEIFTDRGADDAILAALLAVAEDAPNPDETLVEAARQAFRASDSRS
jgi:hypothetical protein